MIERSFVSQHLKEYMIEEFISENLKKVGHSHTKMIRTPLGEKIIIFTSRPGLIVGRKGQNIKKLTKTLKKKFQLDDPQIEISEVENIFLDPQIVAEKIANSLERFGTARFKGIGHKVIADVMKSGAGGIEIIISGKIPSARAKRWRFYSGYLKKCGNTAKEDVLKAYTIASLKTGIVGIQVRIIPSNIKLPDKFTVTDTVIEEAKKEELEEDKKEESPEKPKKETAKKKRKARKKAKKKGSEKEKVKSEANEKEGTNADE